jgi:hypothetical protein
VLYSSSVWVDALSKVKTVGELCRAQRSALISTSTNYRTVSHAVLCVLTGPCLFISGHGGVGEFTRSGRN